MGRRLAGCTLRIPVHVTGLWLPVRRRGDPFSSGSLGAGLLLEPGVEVRASPCGPGVRCGFRGLHAPGLGGPVVPGVVYEVYRFDPGLASAGSVEAWSPVPLGYGYAVSAAAALAAAVGLGVLRGGGSLEGLAALAHAAEVEAGTGLGDVAAVFYGRMMELRVSPGAPGRGARVESFPVDARVVLVFEHGGPMATEEMHRALGERLHRMAAPRLARLLEDPGFDRFLEEARGFSLEAGWLPERLVEALEAMRRRGLLRGWYAKKRVTVAVPEAGYEGDVEAELAGLGVEPRRMRPSPSPLAVDCSGGGGGDGGA